MMKLHIGGERLFYIRSKMLRWKLEEQCKEWGKANVQGDAAVQEQE